MINISDNFQKEMTKNEAVNILLKELKKGEDSAKSSGWIAEEEVINEFGLDI